MAKRVTVNSFKQIEERIKIGDFVEVDFKDGETVVCIFATIIGWDSNLGGLICINNGTSLVNDAFSKNLPISILKSTLINASTVIENVRVIRDVSEIKIEGGILC